jgi:hypothetical protein
MLTNKSDRDYSKSEEEPLLDPLQSLNIHEEPTLIKINTFIRDLWYALEHFTWPTFCRRKLICGLKVADPELSRSLYYGYSDTVPFEWLKHTFNSKGHDIRIGTCQIRNEGIFNVIIVKERRQNRYMVHKLSNGTIMRRDYSRDYLLQDDIVYVYEKLPIGFVDFDMGLHYWIGPLYRQRIIIN